jgi:hypothetical protein
MEIIDYLERVNDFLGESGEEGKEREKNCFICSDEGRVLYTKEANGFNYDYYAACICDAGKKYCYEGRLCSAKSDYRMARIDEVMSEAMIEEITMRNRDESMVGVKTKGYRIHQRVLQVKKIEII